MPEVDTLSSIGASQAPTRSELVVSANLFGDRQTEVLSKFTPEQQAKIKYNQQVLSSLGYFIGKDFKIPVYAGLPSAENPSGWRFTINSRNPSERYIQMNAVDLLNLPMERLRFRTCHEASHVRITRFADIIPIEEWNQTGFSFLMNVIEDPRNNNFFTEAYPRSRQDMVFEYEAQKVEEIKAKEEAKAQLGYTPKFMQAGHEYIKQWYREAITDPSGFSKDLPDDVRAVVEKTIDAARDSWLHYPLKAEADQSEDLIRRYSQASYEINRDKVWPEFKKLVEEDLQNQEIQEALKDTQQSGEGKEGGEGEGAQGLESSLTPEEQQELKDAISKAQQKAGEGKGGQPSSEAGESTGKPAIIDLDSLSDGLKQKVQDYIDALPEEVKEKLREMAAKALEEFEKKISEGLEGKLVEKPKEKIASEKKDTSTDVSEEPVDTTEPRDSSSLKEFQDLIEQALNKNENVYEEKRREVIPIIDELENDLRELFVARRAQRWLSGYKSGKRIDLKRRIQEKAKGISAVESEAWQKRELPQEKDYAIALLVDLSGSMQGNKINETFKGAIVLAEVLNRLSINTEILGFNDKLYVYQAFGQDMSRDVREHMGGMLQEVVTPAARWNDDGWAVEQTSQRLARQRANEKFLFVLSDGVPEESPKHARSKYELGKIVKKVMTDTNQKLIGLGIGEGTEHVENYYPNSIANISVEEMSDQLANVIREVMMDSGNF